MPPRERGPAVVVLSSLFPSAVRPRAGLFVRERMFRVARRLPLTVVSPVPWFPGQGLLRLLRPGYRPMPPRREVQEGIEVHHPRFLALPAVGRWLDGWSMALACLPLLARLRREGRLDVLDAHFGYPDGFAAAWLGRRLGVPAVVTLRGTEVPLSRTRLRGRLLAAGLRRAARVLAVSGSLARLARALGVPASRIEVVPNGVDGERFRPADRRAARRRFGLPEEARVLVTVGGLCERKGFHRVIERLPGIARRFPDVHYLVVGGPSPEGDWSGRLRALADRLGVAGRVRFAGELAPEDLRWALSAADVFVLASRNEGWANVLLEAMACGLPVVATDVGGNREVVCRPELGIIVPFGDGGALEAALVEALGRAWDRDAIRAHALANGWEGRVARLEAIFRELAGTGAARGEAAGAPRRRAEAA